MRESLGFAVFEAKGNTENADVNRAGDVSDALFLRSSDGDKRMRGGLRDGIQDVSLWVKGDQSVSSVCLYQHNIHQPG